MLSDAAGPVTASADHGSALAEGQRLANFTGRMPGSADVLLGLMRAGGAAARRRAGRGRTAARMGPPRGAGGREAQFSPPPIERASHDIAARLGANQTSSLHLLLALLRAGGSAAELLRMGGQDPGKIRALVLRAL